MIHSNLFVRSLIRKLCHNLQLEFDTQCATNWRYALVYGWQICQRVIIAQDGSNV